MLRRITICLICLASGATAFAEAPKGQQEAGAETSAASAAAEPAAAKNAAPEPGAADEEAARAADANESEADDEGVITTTVVQGERFRYSMTLRRAGTNEPGIVCSYDRRTGSHFRHRYCRTDEMAKLERQAAREFLEKAARNRGN